MITRMRMVEMILFMILFPFAFKFFDLKWVTHLIRHAYLKKWDNIIQNFLKIFPCGAKTCTTGEIIFALRFGNNGFFIQANAIKHFYALVIGDRRAKG